MKPSLLVSFYLSRYFQAILVGLVGFGVFITAPTVFAAGTVGTGTALSCDEAAFDAAFAGGGIVNFDCGPAPHTITFTGVKIVSADTSVNGGSLITLDGGDAVKLFQMNAGVTFTLNDITLSNGFCNGSSGGAITNFSASGILNTNNVIFDSNSCNTTGGAVQNNGTASFTSSTFVNNFSSSAGGVFVGDGIFTVATSTFTGNSAAQDGAVFRLLSGANLSVYNSDFDQNFVTSGAKVVYAPSGASATFITSNFFDNTGSGTSLIDNAGTLLVSRSAFYDNTGTIISSSGSADVVNNTFGQNSSGAFSSILYFFGGTANVSSNTIAYNTAFTSSIYQLGAATVTLEDNILFQNTPVNCVGTIVSNGGNIDGDAAPTCAYGGGDFTGTNPELGPLTTASMVDSPSRLTTFYPLLSTSPAIDSTNAVPVKDQLGSNRPIDGDGDLVGDDDIGSFEYDPALDFIAPAIAQVTAVSSPGNDTTPNYTFSSSEAGNISYGGDCSSATAVAVAGNNTVTFNTLTDGPHNNCTIVVTDAALHVSNTLNVSAFTIDATVPVLAEVTPVPTPNANTTPSYTFSSTEAGNITYGGDCTSATVVAVAGNNMILLNALTTGVHSNCTVQVTDSVGNASALLDITDFEITSSSGGGGGGSAGGKAPAPPKKIDTVPVVPPVGDTGTSSGAFFSDIAGHWSENYILELHASCAVDGYRDEQGNLLHLFRPNNRITRGELITLIVKCKEGILTGGNSGFVDVLPSHFAAPYIARAYDLGVVNGYSDGTFRPDDVVNRAEALKMVLMMWVSLSDIEKSPQHFGCSDLDLGAWYEPFFSYALGNGIVSGYQGPTGNLSGECGPGNDLIRSEAAKIITLVK